MKKKIQQFKIWKKWRKKHGKGLIYDIRVFLGRENNYTYAIMISSYNAAENIKQGVFK